MLLNFASSRSFNDATQYPVFPWVITDYKNDRFPEEQAFIGQNPNQRGWRDLSKPIGALSPEKLEKFKSKYFQLVSKSPNSSPFLKNVVAQPCAADGRERSQDQDEEEPVDQAHMYLSHYSTMGTAFYYLIRKFPSYLIQL